MPKQLVKLTIILILILLSTSLNAQVDTTKADKGVNINFFNGYAISYKWNANQNMSYRVYLNLSSSFTNSDYDQESKHNDTIESTREGNESSYFVYTDLSFQFIFNIISQKSFDFYLGVGPNLNYSYNKWEDENSNESYDNNYNHGYENSRKSYGVGIISLIGIEAYITNSISLFAETHFTGMKHWSDYSNNSNGSDYTRESTNTSSGWNANLNLVKVGLGIYF